jgi:hypothetical protein
MAKDNTFWFPSKVDWWLGLLLLVAPLISLAGWFAAAEGERWAASSGLLVLAAAYLGLVFPMRYGLTATHLVVRHGLVRQKIELSKITSVEPTRSPLSSPALSLDRLRITFGAGFFKKVMISPAAKQEFLAELALRARLVRNGDGLVRVNR